MFGTHIRSHARVTKSPDYQLSSSFIIFFIAYMSDYHVYAPFKKHSAIYIIIQASRNANLFQVLLVLFHFIFTFTTEERNRHFNEINLN